jgi:alkylhydroperoxidase family enzyme
MPRRDLHTPRPAGDPESTPDGAWIEVIPEAEASDDLADLFDLVRDRENGRVDHIMSVHSLHPAGLRTHFEVYREVMSGTPTLRKVEREILALVVSRLNECHY